MAHASAFHNLSTYLGAWMGSITATGSVSALTFLDYFYFIQF
jgi:NAD/NADP transhydrogenase beta subunit